MLSCLFFSLRRVVGGSNCLIVERQQQQMMHVYMCSFPFVPRWRHWCLSCSSILFTVLLNSGYFFFIAVVSEIFLLERGCCNCLDCRREWEAKVQHSPDGYFHWPLDWPVINLSDYSRKCLQPGKSCLCLGSGSFLFTDLWRNRRESMTSLTYVVSPFTGILREALKRWKRDHQGKVHDHAVTSGERVRVQWSRRWLPHR